MIGHKALVLIFIGFYMSHMVWLTYHHITSESTCWDLKVPKMSFFLNGCKHNIIKIVISYLIPISIALCQTIFNEIGPNSTVRNQKNHNCTHIVNHVITLWASACITTISIAAFKYSRTNIVETFIDILTFSTFFKFFNKLFWN